MSNLIELRLSPRRLAILCCLTLVLLSAGNSASAQLLPIKVYTTSDGLARDRVTRIRKDSRGFLWFCTAEGLSRFDGYGFTNYSVSHGMASASIRDFLETHDGIYWVATLRGLYRFDPYGDKSNSMFIPAVNGPLQNISFGSLFEDSKGNVWCGGINNLYRLERDGAGGWRLTETGIAASVYYLIEDHSGALWMASDRGLVRRFPDGKVETYTEQNGLPGGGIRGLLERSDGSIWVGSSGGVCELERDIDPSRTNIAKRVITRDNRAAIGATWLFESADKHIWVCGGNGLFELTPENDDFKITYYSSAQGLSGNFMWSMIEDRDGNSWVSSNTGGVMKVARNGLTTWRSGNGLESEFVLGITESLAGELCVTSRSPHSITINKFSGGAFREIDPRYPTGFVDLGDEAQQAPIQDHAGQWWIPTKDGLVRYERTDRVEDLAIGQPKKVYTAKDGLGGDWVFRLFEDSNGDVWIGTFTSSSVSRVTRWERSTDKLYNYSEKDGVPRGTTSGFAQDRFGNIWVAFQSGFVARYKDGRFESFPLNPTAAGRRLHDVYADRAGRVWIGSAENGVFETDRPNDSQPQFINYAAKDGLSSDEVWGITEDNLGNIYFGTGRGLDRFKPDTKRIKHYTTADGLTSNYVLMVYRDRQGYIWAGTQRGVSRFRPEPDRPTEAPPIFISSIRLAGEKYPLTEFGETAVSLGELQPNQDKLNIAFFALSLASGEKLRYQYKLENTDASWSEPSEQRSVDFANLKAGRYRFLVQAITADGTSSKSPAIVSFTILPPIWRRWWFIALVLLLIATPIIAIVRNREQRLKAERAAEEAILRAREDRVRELERVRTRIATDLHDDIGSSLTRISLLSEVAQRQADGQLRSDLGPLPTIAGLSRELVDSMSDIVWAINPHKDHLSDLTQRMRHFASDLFTARQIAFRFIAPELNDDIQIGASYRREVFLIFKETINNMVRHSACTEAEIEFRAKPEELWLRMTDNGNGFDTTEKSQGHGLMSMRKRAQEMGGTFEIVSQPSEGTTVILVIPLPNLKGSLRSNIAAAQNQNR